ncbi:MAG: hypothetical protein FWD69_18080, partial [Polyangiaceae bacterium]|nr:hypothetical protein [Polyangiaceae bacterium]
MINMRRMLAHGALVILISVPIACSGSSSDEVGAASSDCNPLVASCEVGDKCTIAIDCVSNLCSQGICRTPSPANGKKDGDETDIDCGGSMAPACLDGMGCLVGADC